MVWWKWCFNTIVYFPKTHNSGLITKKIPIPIEKHLQNIQLLLFKIKVRQWMDFWAFVPHLAVASCLKWQSPLPVMFCQWRPSGDQVKNSTPIQKGKVLYLITSIRKWSRRKRVLERRKLEKWILYACIRSSGSAQNQDQNIH